VNTDKRCTRCGHGEMKRWSQLTDEELEVVKRLPGAASYTVAEREALHQWCTRCWNEETDKPQQA
jgi:ribosomal protein L37E